MNNSTLELELNVNVSKSEKLRESHYVGITPEIDDSLSTGGWVLPRFDSLFLCNVMLKLPGLNLKAQKQNRLIRITTKC
jgi:hypothetical protein